MAAIISTQFRVLNAGNFKEEVTEAGNSLYLGIGKPDAWSNSISDLTDTIEFDPYDTYDNVNEAKQNLLGLKKIGNANISHVVQRYNWASGSTYTPWDSNDQDIYDKAFYIITDEFKVYKCIVAGTSGSTIKPTQTNVSPTAEADGYTWKYMYTLAVADAEKFLTTSYIPIKTVSEDFVDDAAAEAALTEADYTQYLNQKASRASATAAGIERIEIVAGGVGYSSAPTITITGDGSGATATCTVSSGIVNSITVTNKGTGYSIAHISFSGAGDATAHAVIAPPSGHGTDPVQELGAFFIGVNTQLDGNEGEDITVDNDFRQITLIKNPKSGGNLVTAETINPLKYLDYTSAGITGTIAADEIISGGTSNAKAFIANVDVTNGRIDYTQNSKSGYGIFQGGETVTSSINGGSATLEATPSVDGEMDLNTGEVLFIENREAINRSASQIEDLKLIVEF